MMSGARPVLLCGSANLWDTFPEATGQGQWLLEPDLEWKHVQESVFPRGPQRPMWNNITYFLFPNAADHHSEECPADGWNGG